MAQFDLLLRTIRTRVLTGFAALILLQAGVAVAVWQAENGVDSAIRADAAAEASAMRVNTLRQILLAGHAALADYLRTDDAADREKVTSLLAKLTEASGLIGGGLDSLGATAERMRAGLEAALAAAVARRDRAADLWHAAAAPENTLSALSQAITRAPDQATAEAVAVAIAAAIHPLAFAQRYAFSNDPADGDAALSAVADVRQALDEVRRDAPGVTPRLGRLLTTADEQFAALGPAVRALGEANVARGARMVDVTAAAAALNETINTLNARIGAERILRGAETASARRWVRVTTAGAASIAVLVGVGLAALVLASIMRAARRQAATQSFLDAVLENVPAPIFVKDARDLSYVHVNRAGEEFHGASRATLLSSVARDALPAAAAKDSIARDQDVLARGGTVVHQDVLVPTAYNGERLATVTSCAIPGPNGRPEYIVTMLEDVTERRAAERRIAHMAHFDALTDLPNRTMFADKLAEALAESNRTGAGVAVLGIDLDHFKEVNDTLGHAAGDLLLREAAARMKTCLRDSDTLGRIGGDEFAIIECNVRSVRDAESLAGRLIEAIRKPFDLDGQRVFVGLSVGIALGAPGIGSGELVKRADMALYEAKQGGRGTFRCFVPEMDARLRDRRALENDLRAAVGTEQISLRYQPKVDLRTGAIVGAEALMRWHRPGHGDVSPAIFIPFAEDTGLIGPLGAWLLEVACAEAARWPEHLHVAVNVSPVQLGMQGFHDSVSAALAAAGLDPARLELEVTERVLLEDTKTAQSIFGTLRRLGVRLALDDFGTGHASLAYLQKFQFDSLKIDRCFIKDMEPGSSASAITAAVVGLSHALGMRTVAEGVESDHETAQLRAMGCIEAQGYRFWRPMPAEDMRALVTSAPAKTFDSAVT